MKIIFRPLTVILFVSVLVFTLCTKNKPAAPDGNVNPPPPPPPPLAPTICTASRPVRNATLVPVASFGFNRCGIAVATANNKILFAGGWTPYATNHVDIYDISTNTWTAGVLSDNNHRVGVSVTTLGNKVFFAGGDDGIGDFVSAAVDIYDALNNTWSTTQLSTGRSGIASAALGNKVYFAGGWGYNIAGGYGTFNTVDIYDNTTNTWGTTTLSEARTEISATTVDDKIFFAGGRNDNNYTNKIDILNGANNTWTTSTLAEARSMISSIATVNKIFWAGGLKQNGVGWTGSNHVEIRDLNTGSSSYSCVFPKWSFSIAKKNEYIVFFTGVSSTEPNSATQFDIFNTLTNEWSVGLLSIPVNYSSIISVNNTIYVAGGMNATGALYDKLWKLEF